MSIFNFLKKRSKDIVPPIAHGEDGISQVGHRTYVGGMWNEIGTLQFEFLKKQGLKPTNVFLDLACGSLRAGIHLIPYLNSGNYLGVDKEKTLIDLGLKHELNEEIYSEKIPEFLISNSFDFKKLSKIPDFGIAQSLFTHLPPNLIEDCLKKLSQHFDINGKFYATYFITEESFKNPSKAHDHGIFKYSIEEVKQFGDKNGWNAEYIGDWNHPREQKIVKYTLKK